MNNYHYACILGDLLNDKGSRSEVSWGWDYDNIICPHWLCNYRNDVGVLCGIDYPVVSYISKENESEINNSYISESFYCGLGCSGLSVVTTTNFSFFTYFKIDPADGWLFTFLCNCVFTPEVEANPIPSHFHENSCDVATFVFFR